MKYRNTSPTRSNALRPARGWRMSSIPRAGIRRRSLSARTSLLLPSPLRGRDERSSLSGVGVGVGGSGGGVWATPLPTPPRQGGREQIKSGVHGDYTLSSPL